MRNLKQRNESTRNLKLQSDGEADSTRYRPKREYERPSKSKTKYRGSVEIGDRRYVKENRSVISLRNSARRARGTAIPRRKSGKCDERLRRIRDPRGESWRVRPTTMFTSIHQTYVRPRRSSLFPPHSGSLSRSNAERAVSLSSVDVHLQASSVLLHRVRARHARRFHRRRRP